MSILRRKPSAEVVEADEVVEEASPTGLKGRPTPKRRTVRAPVAKAPTTRKEAVAWQKQHASKPVAGQKKLSPTEYRAAIRTGEVLPRRDQGPVRALARDYVDSRRMASNYLLLLFPLLLVGYFIPYVQIVVLLLFFALLAEWIFSGAKVKRLAADRGITSRETSVGLGFYMGSRAYFKRSWRRPLPAVALGDEI